MNRRPHSSSNQDSLDALLAQARWPEPSKDSADRLTATWNELTQRPARRIPLWRPIFAAAAVLIVAFGIASTLVHRSVTRKPFLAMIPTVNQPKASAPAGREPTAREWILIHAAERRDQHAQVKATTPASIKPAIGPASAPSAEAALAALIEQSDGHVGPALAKQFCDAAGPKSLPLVLRLRQDPQLRPLTTGAMVRLADATSLATAARDATSPAECRQLIAGVLDRTSRQTLPIYLNLVADQRTRPEALAALDGRLNPPTDALIAVLSGPRADLRLAAAWALGRIDGPATTRRLIRLIDTGQSQQEAFIALASSRGEDAQSFLRQAVASDRLCSWARSAIAQTETQQTEIQ